MRPGRKTRAQANNDLIKEATTGIEDINAAHAYVLGWCLASVPTKELKKAIESARLCGFIKPREGGN